MPVANLLDQLRSGGLARSAITHELAPHTHLQMQQDAVSP
jgi:hypothetical protein